ncbi:hypothetical protein M0804_009600 [Polistes exclamans]|nr:hypothetical protein M0804_009600 [Polistes exclamans]
MLMHNEYILKAGILCYNNDRIICDLVRYTIGCNGFGASKDRQEDSLNERSSTCCSTRPEDVAFRARANANALIRDKFDRFTRKLLVTVAIAIAIAVAIGLVTTIEH